MINRRKFLKNSVLAGVSLFVFPNILNAASKPYKIKKVHKYKHWVWINPKDGEKDKDIEARYVKFRDAGIKGIFFGRNVENHFRIAKSLGLETHRWIWIMNNGDKALLEQHPDWYAKNRNGESCAVKPPYVGYYRWLCPSREDVQQYIFEEIENALKNKYVDGIHLDYIRYCDIVLPVNLWKNYHIEQIRELPEYDYCYCDVCRNKFREQYGMELDQIEFPEASLSWRQFRYNAITNIVNKIAEITTKYNKKVTAAVFPTPEVVRRNVRQDWVNWNLDAIYPMIYHNFYKENVSWIGDAVKEGVRGLNNRFPLYAGLHLPDFKDDADFREGVRYALKNGASGVSLFGDVTENILNVLKEFQKYRT